MTKLQPRKWREIENSNTVIAFKIFGYWFLIKKPNT